MNNRTGTLGIVSGLLAAALLSLLISAAGHSVRQGATNVPPQALTAEDVSRILEQALAAEKAEPSLLRRDSSGDSLPTRMHIAIVDAKGKTLKAHATEWAWLGSASIAVAKAYTAVAFSSHNNALSTRSIGEMSKPDGPLWHIGNARTSRDAPGLIEFPGGLPLYKAGQLVGAIGVSGDGVDQDETVAKAGAKGFEPPEAIRIDQATNGAVSYTR